MATPVEIESQSVRTRDNNNDLTHLSDRLVPATTLRRSLSFHRSSLIQGQIITSRGLVSGGSATFVPHPLPSFQTSLFTPARIPAWGDACALDSSAFSLRSSVPTTFRASTIALAVQLIPTSRAPMTPSSSDSSEPSRHHQCPHTTHRDDSRVDYQP